MDMGDLVVKYFKMGIYAPSDLTEVEKGQILASKPEQVQYETIWHEHGRHISPSVANRAVGWQFYDAVQKVGG